MRNITNLKWSKNLISSDRLGGKNTNKFLVGEGFL